MLTLTQMYRFKQNWHRWHRFGTDLAQIENRKKTLSINTLYLLAQMAQIILIIHVRSKKHCINTHRNEFFIIKTNLYKNAKKSVPICATRFYNFITLVTYLFL